MAEDDGQSEFGSSNGGAMPSAAFDISRRGLNAWLCPRTAPGSPLLPVTALCAYTSSPLAPCCQASGCASSQCITQTFRSWKYKGPEKKPSITNQRQISRPGLRIYANHRDISKVLGGQGL